MCQSYGRNEDHEKKISWSCCGGLSGDGRDETAGTGACRVSWQPLAFCRDCLHPSCHGVLAERRTQTASLTHVLHRKMYGWYDHLQYLFSVVLLCSRCAKKKCARPARGIVHQDHNHTARWLYRPP
ncbi:uncharacterized protein LOC133474370 isoform X5 [Phyllopteryx taeniolatus]|uniref:uncharacterized protein LOC133474370 isoform X5 n=1 Tax=Phyllopteryx taeniolatus TaxID=161469 RepID=UPI002AD2F471|nr:uncharacterized protein LOC133474370 isoform X5 [Phyllopteryx taeniolatus]